MFGVLALVTASITIKTVYLLYTYDIDPYKWPTVVMLALLIEKLLFIKKSTDKEVHKWTPKGMLLNTVWLAYYGYVLFLIMKVNESPFWQ